MKKCTLLFMSLVFATSFLMAQTSDVTISVDMRGISDIYTGGTVWLNMADDWSEYYDMTDADGDSIYSVTLSKDESTTIQYRFSYQTGADPDNDYVEETVPGGCDNGFGFRGLTVPTADTVLPVSAYEICAGNTLVTFRVDLNAITDLYNGGSVWVLFDDWTEWYDMYDEDGDGVYLFTMDTAWGATLNYRFAYQTGADPDNDYVEETVPAACDNGSGNRQVVLAGGYTVQPAYAYGSCSETPPGAVVDVTLSIDMQGTSDLYTDGAVWVLMDAGWSEYYELTDADGDSIYAVTIEKEAGTTLPYRFSYQTGADPNADYVEETVPGGCDNGDGFREMMIPDADTNLPTTMYANCMGDTLVTFRVDLNGVSDLYTDGAVWVLFDDWTEWYDMVDEDGDGVYIFTLDTTWGATLNYRFAYQTGADPDNDYAEETIPGECDNGGGNRQVILEGGYTLLPAFAYGSCSETPVVMIDITYSVDMTGESASDVMVVNKTLWIWTALTEGADNIWTGVQTVPADATYAYTFVNGGQDNWAGEEKLPDDCNAGTPSAPERQITVADADTVLDLVAFGSCTDQPAGKVNVTFSVDMSAETVSGDGVQLVIKGPWIWTPLVDQGDGIWQATVPLNINSTYPYTFVNGAQDYWDGEESVPEECNFGTASAPERRLELADSDSTLETVAFGACPEVETVNVTFRVDMKDESVSGDGVQIVIKDPWIWTAMTDADEDGIWEALVALPLHTSYPFSFVNGAQDYWSGEEVITGDCKDGDNNQRMVQIEDNDTILMAYVFGTCEERSETGINQTEQSMFTIFPNPVNTLLTVESEEFTIHSVKLYDISGRVVLERSNVYENSVSIETHNLNAGLYNVIIQGDNGKFAAKLLVSH
jgi:hypothetical protein